MAKEKALNPLDLLPAAGDVLSGISSSISDIESGKLTQAQAAANISTYEQYLRDFPQYESFKKTQYQVTEAQTLADRLATMGMRGISAGGGAAGPTSGTLAYTGEKSLYDAGYQQLVASLQLDKTVAEGQLSVAEATLGVGKKMEAGGTGGLIGGILGGIIGFVGSGFNPLGAIAGYKLGQGAGTLIGQAVG